MSPDTTMAPSLVAPVLSVRDLSVVLGRKLGTPGFVAVNGISFDVGEAEVVGLVGESGSGKSSTAYAITRLVPIAGGVVLLGAVDVAAMSRGDLRRRRADMQMVFQDPQGSLDPRQRIRAGLLELRKLHGKRAEWIEDVDLMERVGLAPSLLDRIPSELSGGQAQRVSIARALLPRPRLIIADEPTSALDVSVQQKILAVLRAIVDEDGVSMLFISHDLAVVRALCDRVNVMRQGQIVEAGPTEQVLGDPQHPYTRALIEALPGVHAPPAEQDRSPR